uniref:Uncharacterized protein n=1 Tax=Panagrolaimus sp. PS1159 TaxID=55785 RepID=A0AC35FWZ0_9BILA
MNFGVVKVPQLFIMMISIRVALMFRINATILSKALARTKQFPIREALQNYFEQLLDIIKILNMLERCFNKLMLAIVATSVIKVIFTGYATTRELLYSEKFENIGMKSIFLDNDQEFENQDGFLPYLTTLDSICSVFSVILNTSWTLIFLIPCIYCNEFSRSALAVITSKLVCDDAKNIKDQIVQKLMDPSWNLTLGKLIVVDRTFAMTVRF